MKNSTIIFLSIILLTFFNSCEKKELVYISSNPVPPSLLQPADGMVCNFTAANGNESFNIKWTNADYGFNAIYSYTVQIDKQGNNFAKPTKLGTSEVDSFLYSVDRFNSSVKKLKFAAGDEANIEIRVVSIVSPAVDDLNSNVNTLKYKVY
jgi:starch-binding outer membrane protein SusE/F